MSCKFNECNKKASYGNRGSKTVYLYVLIQIVTSTT